ncbi:hypothetical protein [Streptomyces albus]
MLPYGGLPKQHRAKVLEAMAGRTAEQVIERAARRWVRHGYADAHHSAGGRGIGSPVGVALALIEPGQCEYARCEDGTDIDTGQECRACEARRTARKAGAGTGRGVPAARPAAHRPGWWTCTACDAPGVGAPPVNGECAECRREAEVAGRRLAERLEHEAAERQADRVRAAALALEPDEEELDRAARKQAVDEATARLRAELAAQFPDLAAVSGSVQEAQQALTAPFERSLGGDGLLASLAS